MTQVIMKFVIVSGFLMVLGIAGILVATLVSVRQANGPRVEYGIILDAGSSSTCAYIYQWEHRTTYDLPTIAYSMSDKQNIYMKKIEPGIATFDHNSTMVANYLEPLIDWAYDKVPDSQRDTTPIFLLGTGSLRELPLYDASILLTSVRYALQSSGFSFENEYADILSGNDEAGYGFIAVNALYGNFDDDREVYTMYGSLDMGGVTSNIAYITKNSPPTNNTFTRVINATSYEVYVQSQDGWGASAAQYAFNASLFANSTSYTIIDPCLPIGYSQNLTNAINGFLRSITLVGSSDYGSCNSKVTDMVAEMTSDFPSPPVPSSTFVVSDKYLKLKDFFKLKDNANLLELQAKVESFCTLSLYEAINHHSKYASTVQNYCFMGTYVGTLLKNFYQLSPSSRQIFWKNQINGSPVSWTLGAMVDHVSSIPPNTQPYDSTHLVKLHHTDLGKILIFVSVLVFSLGILILVLSRRKTTYIEIR